MTKFSKTLQLSVVFFIALFSSSLFFTASVVQAQTPGLVAAYGFNAVSNPLLDDSGNGLTGVCTPGVTCPQYTPTGGHMAPGNIPTGAYDFVGAGNFIELPNESLFDFSKTMTVEFWMKTPTLTLPWEGIVTKGNTSWSVSRHSTLQRLAFSTYAPAANHLKSSINLQPNTWVHVAAVYTGTQKQFYINGVQRGVANYTKTLSQNNLPVVFGVNQSIADTGYAGLLDDIRIYNRALSAAEIITDMNTPVNPSAPTPTPTPSPTPTNTPTPTATPSATPSPTPTATPTATPSPTPSPTPTATPSPTAYPTPPANTPIYPLKVSSDTSARYLVDQNNVPVFLNGDTPWSLIGEASNEQAESYIIDSAARGFNSIIVTLTESHYTTHFLGGNSNRPTNFYGVEPFVFHTGTYVADFSQPVEAYFAHADWVIAKAAQYGLQVILAPNYLGCCSDGYLADLESPLNSQLSAASYGAFIGNRYKDFPNIMYVWGNDTNPCGNYSTATGCETSLRINAMASAAKAADPNHVHSFHGSPEFSAVEIKDQHGYSWIDVNATYTYNPVQDAVAADYTHSPSMPFFMFESHYERDWGNRSPLEIRAEAYNSVLSGASGNHYGNNPIWHMNSVVIQNITTSWLTHFDDEGRRSMAFFNNLFKSRNWTTLVPDFSHQTLTAGYSSGASFAGAARTSDGLTAIAYTPDDRNLTIAMSRIAGTEARAWWFNPLTGTAQLIGTFPTTGSQIFNPPAAGDWVLVLDRADANLPAPGATTPDTEYPVVTLTAPQNQATVSGTLTLSATATDNVAVSGVQFRLDGANLGALDTTSPYQTSWDSVGSTNGAHILDAVAIDSSGNATPSASVTVQVQNTTDTTAPSVTLTSPAPLATVSGTINVTADATDNVAVASVQFKLDGANLGAADTAAPYSVSWDTTTATNSAHLLTAVATDTAGLSQTSSIVAVTVSNLTPSGLLVSYGFNGTNALADSSGNNRTASCTSCPVWNDTTYHGPSGKSADFADYGKYVVLPNESLFDFTTNMTVSFWMRSASMTHDWEAFVAKGDSAWGVSTNSFSSIANFTTFYGTNSVNDLWEGSGGTLLNTDQWRHIAVTYDGQNKKLYIDGAVVASTAFTQAIKQNNYAVRLGYNEEYTNGQYGGLLDDVRIYNRALSQSEIVSDMNTPVN